MRPRVSCSSRTAEGREPACDLDAVRIDAPRVDDDLHASPSRPGRRASATASPTCAREACRRVAAAVSRATSRKTTTAPSDHRHEHDECDSPPAAKRPRVTAHPARRETVVRPVEERRVHVRRDRPSRPAPARDRAAMSSRPQRASRSSFARRRSATARLPSRTRRGSPSRASASVISTPSIVGEALLPDRVLHDHRHDVPAARRRRAPTRRAAAAR